MRKPLAHLTRPVQPLLPAAPPAAVAPRLKRLAYQSIPPRRRPPPHTHPTPTSTPPPQLRRVCGAAAALELGVPVRLPQDLHHRRHHPGTLLLAPARLPLAWLLSFLGCALSSSSAGAIACALHPLLSLMGIRARNNCVCLLLSAHSIGGGGAGGAAAGSHTVAGLQREADAGRQQPGAPPVRRRDDGHSQRDLL